jgi:branched-chain amino acid transport system permease protein
MSHNMQILFDGLASGAGYVLVALSFSLIFGVVGVLNVAQADFYMLGAYVSIYAMLHLGTNVAVGAAAALVGGVLVGLVLYWVVVRRLQSEQQMAAFVATLGLSMFLENVIARIAGPNPQTFPQLIPQHFYTFAGVVFPAPSVVLIVVALIMSAGLLSWLKYAPFGRNVRAVAESRFIAAVLGINVRRTMVVAITLSTVTAMFGGLIIGNAQGTVTPFLGTSLAIKMFIVALVAGAGSVTGVVVVGFSLGIVESLTVAFVSSAWQDMAGLLVLVLVLLLRPQGIFGQEARVG